LYEEELYEEELFREELSGKNCLGKNSPERTENIRFISRDSCKMFGLGTGKRKKVQKSVIYSPRHLFTQARRRVDLALCI
jgi:hypothetical protein